jgi:anti-anti-sigma factor
MELSFNKVWERETSGGNIALWVRGDHYALHINGTLDAASTEVVSPALDSILDQHPKELIFDLAGLKYLTSMGYRLFLIALKTQKEHGGTVSFIHLQPQIQEVFSIMGSLNDLRIFADVAELDHYLLARQQAVERGE